MNPGWHYIYEDCGFISTCWLDSLCQTSHLHCMLWCVHQSKTSNQPAHHVGFRGLSGTCLPSSGSLIQGQITITNLWAHECWSKMFGPGVEYNKFRLLVSQATPGLHYCSPLKPSHKVYPSGPAHAASCWQPLGCSRGPDDWCWCWRGSISDTFALIEAQHPCCLVGMGLKDRLLLHVTRTGHFGSGWAIAVIFVAWANLSIWIVRIGGWASVINLRLLSREPKVKGDSSSLSSGLVTQRFFILSLECPSCGHIDPEFPDVSLILVAPMTGKHM